VRFVARGGSMWPGIPSGSRLELVPCPAAQLQVGDVAAFERNGRVVVHRITDVSHEGVRFQGDNRDQTDGAVAPSTVLARARVLERRPLRLRRPRQGELIGACRSALRRLRPWLVRRSLAVAGRVLRSCARLHETTLRSMGPVANHGVSATSRCSCAATGARRPVTAPR
jgi:hypothetical protein